MSWAVFLLLWSRIVQVKLLFYLGCPGALVIKKWSEVAQSCLTLCNPVDCIAHEVPPPMGFSRQEYWSGLPLPSPGDIPDPGIEPRSPTLQADTLTSEPPGKPNDKEPTCQYRKQKRHGFDSWVWKIPWRREWQPTTVFLPGESHEQRSMVGYSPWGHKESEVN